MIMAQEAAILKGQEQFDAMVSLVRRAAQDGRPIDQVEGDLWNRLLALGRALLEGFVEATGPGDLGPTLEHQGRMLRRLESIHARRYVSVFGKLTIQRHVYGTRETQKHEVVPADARLGLPDGDFSYLLQDWDQTFCVQGSYEQSRRTVERILGLGQSVRSLEQMSESMAQAVEAFQESQPVPPAQEEGSILVLTADGKGVPMRRDPQQDPPAVRGRRKKGQKANKKRMACVGGVYTIEPFVRTAGDVVDEVLRDARKPDRPKPRHKQLRAELTRTLEGSEVNGKQRIFGWMGEQVQARNPDGCKPTVCVMDGERALWKILRQLVPAATCILDIFHVLERLWQAAHCFHAEGSEAAKAFVTDRLDRLLRGQAGYVIGGLKQMATKQRVRGSRKKQLAAAIGYLERNRSFMHYDEYLAAGYPIGSGVAEGACRHLVKDRMELTGMRWCVIGAQAMLNLRAVYINQQWDAFQTYRIEQERHRMYPYRSLVQRKWKPAA
jgi:hypothetical protein